jgi:glycosyltransferase involved in cell wall biosynthesis
MLSRPRLLHVGKFYPPVRGGMEQVLASLCQATRDRIDNEVLAFGGTRRTSHDLVDGIPVTRLGSIAPARSTPVAPEMMRELRSTSADAIVLHEPNPWGLLSCALAKPRQPLIIYYHSEVVRPALQYALFYHPLVRAVYSRASKIIVASPRMAEHARALWPYKDRIAVLPYGTDVAAWKRTPAVDRRVREIRNETGGKPLVLFAGRFVRYKGCEVLLRALTGVDAAAVLAGDGPIKGELVALAATLGVSPRIHFPGEVPPAELLALYHAADVLVLPSITRAEAFGFVQVEAMACGTPVISTDVSSGVPWVNRHGVTGLVVPPGDVAALRDALKSLLADDTARRRMGEAARRRVAEEFTLAMMGERAAEILAAVIGRG